MSCDIDALSRYLDGELSLPARYELDRHLAECGSCAGNLDILRRNDRVIRAWGLRRTPVPTELEQRINRDVRRRRRFGPLLALSKMMPAAVGTSVAALLVLVTASLSLPYAQHSVSGATASPAAANRAIAKQSAQLIMNRRTQAIVADRIIRQQSISLPRRLFDEN